MEAHPEPSERDTTDEWRIAPARSPATVAELEGRIDVALATAQSAEEAALEIGAASLEAAEQARRAAALAERASASAARAADSARGANVTSLPVVAPNGNGAAAPSAAGSAESAAPASPSARTAEPTTDSSAAPVTVPTAPRVPDPFEERVTAFQRRAERVMDRLQRLEAQ